MRSSTLFRPKIFFWIAESVVDIVAVNSNFTCTLLVTGMSSTFFINGKVTLISEPRILPINPPDQTFLDNWGFDGSMLADETLQKLYEDLQLVSQLISIYTEDHFH